MPGRELAVEGRPVDSDSSPPLGRCTSELTAGGGGIARSLNRHICDSGSEQGEFRGHFILSTLSPFYLFFNIFIALRRKENIKILPIKFVRPQIRLSQIYHYQLPPPGDMARIRRLVEISDKRQRHYKK